MLNQPMSSPMMTMMFGFFSAAEAVGSAPQRATEAVSAMIPPLKILGVIVGFLF
jgi:hypothetical protein